MRPVTSAMASWGWYAGTGITIAPGPLSTSSSSRTPAVTSTTGRTWSGSISLAELPPGEPGVRLAERPARLEPRVAERPGLHRVA